MNGLPPVVPEAAAAALDGLPPRLRKRLDGAVAALAGREAVRDGDRVRVAVDEENAVVLTLTGEVVASAADVVCSCLLAPNCLHRAAVLAAAPVAEEPAAPAAAAPEPVVAPDAPVFVPGGAAREAAREVWSAGAEVLAAGVAAAGAVRRTTLLRAAHGARLAGLPGPAAAATRVARRLAEAAGGDPAFRLAELTGDLAELLDAAALLAEGGEGPEAATAAGTARRAYRASGTLRLHGLFTEAVVTASGYAGAVAHAVGEDGTRYTVADVAPGGPERARSAPAAPVPGGAAMSLRELGAGAGLLVDGTRVSEDRRLGGGAGVRTVGVRGAGWDGGAVAALWAVPPAEQVRRALAERGDDLLFLAGVLAAVDGAPVLVVDGGPGLRLLAPDDRPELPYVANLRLLAGCPGLRVRLVARLDRERPGAVAALAVSWAGERVDLGLRALSRSALPAPDGTVAAVPPPGGVPAEVEWLRRAVTRAVEGGRAVVAAAADGRWAARLRDAGLPTGADCLAALDACAARRTQDALGRLVPGDAGGFARAWLAAALYTAAVDRALLASAWEAAPAG